MEEKTIKERMKTGTNQIKKERKRERKKERKKEKATKKE